MNISSGLWTIEEAKRRWFWFLRKWRPVLVDDEPVRFHSAEVAAMAAGLYTDLFQCDTRAVRLNCEPYSKSCRREEIEQECITCVKLHTCNSGCTGYDSRVFSEESILDTRNEATE